MSSPRLLRRHVLLVCTATLGIVIVLFGTPTAPAGAETALATAETSPIGVPFIGTYEIWCTDRNPAPGDRCSRHHGSPAIDLGMDIGTPINATGSGVVIETETGCGPGFCRGGAGNFISIGHADGSFSRYLHLTDVFVEAGDEITVGDEIGTSGISGQSSSAHLHYDEHFPAGTRTPMGPWIGCVAGEQVRYPDVFGHTDWNDVPYGSLVVNDGYGCLDGVDVSDVPRPVVLPGGERFGVIAPTNDATAIFELSIDRQDDAPPSIRTLRGTALATFDTPDAPVALRIRAKIGERWAEWSDPVPYDPATVDSTLPTCHGLHATTEAMTGTPTVDVIIGTDGDDTIDGRGGNDVICGNDGDDVIKAGLGQDLVWGGAGGDTISGGRGADKIWADDGDDSVRGGDGPDMVMGGLGNDTLHGTAGNDHVNGGGGDDLVIGGIGHDRLYGSLGSDDLEGRNGRDYLGGGRGDDSLAGGNGRDRLVGAGGTDSFDGGSGDDRCAPDPDQPTELYEGCER